ncbi:hypothetical protein FHS15_003750, partial [Paenibacillus castaneae]|uniref:hypothetical protein n=1 Tax=Paenibacillus castaneae TaxID=474957 RepID=UPI001ABA39E7
NFYRFFAHPEGFARQFVTRCSVFKEQSILSFVLLVLLAVRVFLSAGIRIYHVNVYLVKRFLKKVLKVF